MPMAAHHNGTPNAVDANISAAAPTTQAIVTVFKAIKISVPPWL